VAEEPAGEGLRVPLVLVRGRGQLLGRAARPLLLETGRPAKGARWPGGGGAGPCRVFRAPREVAGCEDSGMRLNTAECSRARALSSAGWADKDTDSASRLGGFSPPPRRRLISPNLAESRRISPNLGDARLSPLRRRHDTATTSGSGLSGGARLGGGGGAHAGTSTWYSGPRQTSRFHSSWASSPSPSSPSSGEGERPAAGAGASGGAAAPAGGVSGLPVGWPRWRATCKENGRAATGCDESVSGGW